MKKTLSDRCRSAGFKKIIKKWLYSESEIFLREIVSNAVDAITKLKRLSSLGEVKDITDSFRIDVALDVDARTITVSDNGIGMSRDEVTRNIGTIAKSGTKEFLKAVLNPEY